MSGKCLILTAMAAGLLLASCRKGETETPAEEVTVAALTEVPEGFPEIPFTEENPYSLAKWELGKKLFYDKALSVDYSTSCASCHAATHAFSDVVAKSLGAGGVEGRRNAPSLANVAYHPYYTREGGLPTLEMQVLVPIQEHDELNYNIVDIADRLAAIPEYVEMSREAFDRTPDAYVITRALATFERTLISGNSAYDKYQQHGTDAAFTDAAQRGLALFTSNRLQCSSCHSGFNFTDYSFRNNGLQETYADPGRKRLTGKEADEGLFKVPSLRNVALTAPYMHDGSLATLEAVIDHYNAGGKAHPNRDSRVQPLGLTPSEKADLVAFLNALTDHTFITDKRFYNEADQ